jgi:hypothetical protein
MTVAFLAAATGTGTDVILTGPNLGDGLGGDITATGVKIPV